MQRHNKLSSHTLRLINKHVNVCNMYVLPFLWNSLAVAATGTGSCIENVDPLVRRGGAGGCGPTPDATSATRRALISIHYIRHYAQCRLWLFAMFLIIPAHPCPETIMFCVSYLLRVTFEPVSFIISPDCHFKLNFVDYHSSRPIT